MTTDTEQNTQLSISNNHSFKLIYIYQITCKNLKIKDNYIGQTICFKTRENTHCIASKDSNLKVYKIIRKNGGWNNWQIKILNHYYCKNDNDARQIEQKYIDFYKPTMNTKNAYINRFKNDELDRQLEFEFKNYSEKLLGCFLYDFLLYSDEYDENKIICEFCNTELCNMYTLKTHKLTNRNCIEIQKMTNTIDEIICEFCDKSFNSKIQLNTHINSSKICKIIQKLKENHKEEINQVKENHKEEINQLKEKNFNLHEQIIKLETLNEIYKKNYDKPNTVNNTNSNNINSNNKYLFVNNFTLIDDIDKIKDIIDNKLSDVHVINGQKGIAKFALESIITDEDGNLDYICSDPSRNVFKYKNNEGEIEKDLKAWKLTNALISTNIAINLWTKDNGETSVSKFETFQPKLQEIITMKNNNTTFRNELTNMTY